MNISNFIRETPELEALPYFTTYRAIFILLEMGLLKEPEKDVD
jgi:hypothetical protein